MSQHSASRSATRIAVAVIVLLGLIAVIVLWRLNGGDQTPAAETDPAPGGPTTGAQTSSPEPEESPQAPEDVEELLEHIVGEPVSVIALPQRPATPSRLTLDCGGDYPTLYFRTTTSGADQAVCADNPGGGHLTYVRQESGRPPRALPAYYEIGEDAFMGLDERRGVVYRVNAASGDVTVIRDGRTVRSERSSYRWEIPEPDGP